MSSDTKNYGPHEILKSSTVSLTPARRQVAQHNIQKVTTSKHPKLWRASSSSSLLFWAISTGLVFLVCSITAAVILAIYRENKYPEYSNLTYRLVDVYSGESFFDQFDYYYGYDPAQGFVHYTDRSAALALNLTYATQSSAILRVDTSEVDTTTGRKSVRIESKTRYSNGLFIFDVVHAPYGCSTWPAIWMTNRYSWPEDGEIDIVEAANAASTGNQVTLHTRNHCKMNVKRKQTGRTLQTDCHNSTHHNAGCGVRGQANTVGQVFNQNGGGVYALEWRDEGIRVWFFNRHDLPLDVAGIISKDKSLAIPDPSQWSDPLADFPNTKCNMTNHFRNHSIIANIDLCGQWAGLPKYYNEQSKCPGDCIDFVSHQPGSAFSEAFWEFGGWWVFSA